MSGELQADEQDDEFDHTTTPKADWYWPLNGHEWVWSGYEDTSEWPPEDRRWARDVYICQHCRRVSKVFQHPPKVWRVRFGMHAAKRCDERPRWWRR